MHIQILVGQSLANWSLQRLRIWIYNIKMELMGGGWNWFKIMSNSRLWY
jgi:hypothetical protein